MLGTGLGRLLREHWRSVQMLAEELHAMFNADIPLTHDAPLTLNTEDQPPLVLNANTTPGVTPQFVAFNNNGEPFGGINLVDGVPQVVDGTGAPVAPRRTTTTATAAVPVVFMGKVLSGSGETYSCELYAAGKTGPPMADEFGATINFTVLCADIDASEVIPPGRWFLVIKTGAFYYMQPPIFEYSGV